MRVYIVQVCQTELLIPMFLFYIPILFSHQFSCTNIGELKTMLSSFHSSQDSTKKSKQLKKKTQKLAHLFNYFLNIANDKMHHPVLLHSYL